MNIVRPQGIGSVVIAGALLLASIAGAAAKGSVPQQSGASPSPTEDPNYPVFTRICGDCHDSGRVVAQRRSKVDWEDVLNKMADKGATGSDDDFNTVLKYLLKHYGLVYINKAPSAELAMVLSLSDKDADAIVAYRKANGNFADFDALAKVPGIDVKALEQHRDAISF